MLLNGTDKTLIIFINTLKVILREMLLCHFDSLFKYYNSLEELNDWAFEDDALYSFVKYHFDLKKNLDSK
jgi:hypothetical protein